MSYMSLKTSYVSMSGFGLNAEKLSFSLNFKSTYKPWSKILGTLLIII